MAIISNNNSLNKLLQLMAIILLQDEVQLTLIKASSWFYGSGRLQVNKIHKKHAKVRGLSTNFGLCNSK